MGAPIRSGSTTDRAWEGSKGIPIRRLGTAVVLCGELLGD